MASCSGNGVEMRGAFIVKVTHNSRRLPGVSVVVTTFGQGENGNKLFSGITSSDGTVRILLPAGTYWLDAKLLGITAGTQCFHISDHASRKAKRKIEYEWGDEVPATRRMAGILIDSRPADSYGSRLENFLHTVDVPIGGAKLKLQNPLTGAVYTAVSDSDGNFSFNGIPGGVYVLHVMAGTTSGGHEYEATDVLIRLSDTAKSGAFQVVWSQPGYGSCGGASLEFGKTSI
jgi:Carboxypeptidase regulatory-like domain